jgi:hypothetical protein
MKISTLIEVLINTGATPEMILAAVKAVEAENEIALANKRANDAKRKRKSRNKDNENLTDVTVSHAASQDVTDVTVTLRDKKDPPFSPPSLSPTPPNSSPPIIPPKKVTSARAEAFERFWQVYPRKKEKRGAEAKFNSLVKSGIDPEAIIRGAQRLAISKPELKYTKHPTTWLNNGCWDDELIDRSDGKNERNNPLMDALDRIDRRLAEQRAFEGNRFDFGDDDTIIELRPAASF